MRRSTVPSFFTAKTRPGRLLVSHRTIILPQRTKAPSMRFEMSEPWKTKYGLRRVKRDPPTLEEAIFAARGLSDDPQHQVEFAASLIGASLDDVRAAMHKS